MKNWKEPQGVQLTLVPTIFRSSIEPLARTYYILENMEASSNFKKIDDAIYQALHIKNVELNDEEQIINFLKDYGVHSEKFRAEYDSFSMGMKIQNAKKTIRTYQISGTPTIVVNGLYVIKGLTPEKMIRVLDELLLEIKKEGNKNL